jgi:hypothetical protein
VPGDERQVDRLRLETMNNDFAVARSFQLNRGVETNLSKRKVLSLEFSTSDR